MEPLRLDVVGVANRELLEQLLEANQSGFSSRSSGVGRGRRYSHLGDVVSIVGAISSMASFCKTVLEILRLPKTVKTPNIVVRATTLDGRELTITADQAKTLKDVETILEALK